MTIQVTYISTNSYYPFVDTDKKRKNREEVDKFFKGKL
jgi:hypothetical protein